MRMKKGVHIPVWYFIQYNRIYMMQVKVVILYPMQFSKNIYQFFRKNYAYLTETSLIPLLMM